MRGENQNWKERGEPDGTEGRTLERKIYYHRNKLTVCRKFLGVIFLSFFSSLD